MNDQLDPQAMALTKAIRQVESGGNFKARSKDGSFGAYQFLKPTWDNTARKYGVNAEWEKATPQQQNEVAYKQIKEWKDKGHNVGEIASMWNAGAGRPQAYLQGVQGTNSSGVNYNVANYAKKVATLYQEYKGQSQPQVQQEPIEPVEPIEPTIQEQKQVIQTQGQPVSVRKDRTQPTLVGGIIRDIVKQPIKAALTIARPFVDPIGKKSGLSVNTKYLGNVGDYGTEIEKSTNNLANKYKAGEISLGRAALGGAGAGALQAMDFAAVAPVGKVASQAIRGTVKQSLVPTLKAAAKESLIRGGAVGAGYDVSSQLASGEKYNPLQTVAAGTVGTVADLGLSYGLPKAISGTKSFAKNNLTKAGRDAKLTRKVEEELFNIENNYAKLRKNQKYSKDANTATRKRIVTTGVLDDAVDTNGTINADNAIKKYRDASGLSGKEGVVRQNLERLGEKLNIKDAEKQLTDTVYTSGLEGAELRTALNNVKKEVSGYRLRADADGNLPLTFFHDAKIGTTNSIDFNTPADIKAYKKTLASGLKDIVENNSQFNVKEVNKELSPLFKDIEYLESLNGRKVKGGKLGKYASQVTGNIVGGVAGGAIGGFPGSAIGTVVGGEVGSALRGSSLSKVLRGPGTKELPVSKVLQKAAATAKSPRLGLPEPKPGLPKSQNFVPIELPGVKEPVYRSPRIAGNTTQYTNIPNTKPKNIDISTQLPKSKVKSSDLSTVVKKAFNDAKDTLKTLKDKNVRERGSISLESILPESKSVGSRGVSLAKNTTEDLVQQAKKYKSAEENKLITFSKKYKTVEGLQNELPRFDSLSDLARPIRATNVNNFPRLKGDEMVTVYRGVSQNATGGVRAGDWITLDEKTAKNYSSIIQKKQIPKSDIVNPGIEKDEYIYAPKEMQSQLTDIWNKANKKVTLPKSSDLSTELVQQAKKYKSAEEFVKAKTNAYHGTDKVFDVFDLNKVGTTQKLDKYGMFFTSEKDVAKRYSSLYPQKPKFRWTEQDKINAEKAITMDAFVDDKNALTFSDVLKLYNEGKIKSKINKDGNVRASSYFDLNRDAIKEAIDLTGKDVFKTTAEGETFYMVNNPNKMLTKSQLTDIWNKANKKVAVELPTGLVQQAKKYKSAEEFVKAQGTPVYHSSKTDIKEFKDIPANGSRYYGKGTYFSKDLDRTKEFGDKVIEANMQLKNPYRQGDDYNPTMQKEIIKIFGKKQGQQIIDNKTLLNSTTVNADLLTKIYEKSGYDGVIARNGLDIAIFNPKETIKTKSQLIDIWNKANKKILPKNTKLIKNKDGSITYGSQKMSGDFKGMPDIEIIKMFDNTPF